MSVLLPMSSAYTDFNATDMISSVGRTSPLTRKRLKQLCEFFENMTMKYNRQILENDHPGIKLQALQRPVGFDCYAGPDDSVNTKYDVIKKKESDDTYMINLNNIDIELKKKNV